MLQSVKVSQPVKPVASFASLPAQQKTSTVLSRFLPLTSKYASSPIFWRTLPFAFV